MHNDIITPTKLASGGTLKNNQDGKTYVHNYGPFTSGAHAQIQSCGYNRNLQKMAILYHVALYLVNYLSSWNLAKYLPRKYSYEWQWSVNKIQPWKNRNSLCIRKWLEIRGKPSSKGTFSLLLIWLARTNSIQAVVRKKTSCFVATLTSTRSDGKLWAWFPGKVPIALIMLHSTSCGTY